MKKILSLLIVLVLLTSVFAGCGNKSKNAGGEILDIAVNEMGNTVEDSSELPDWKGKKIELVKWYAQGTNALDKDKKAETDVNRDEIYRVTGVRFSDDSFDNNGELMDAKISRIIASGDWPDVIVNCESSILQRLIKEDMVYDLSELIPKYMPNLQSYIDKNNGYAPMLKKNRDDGGVYEFSTYFPLRYAFPDMDPSLLARVESPKDPAGYVMVRDDILTQIYPKAKTQKEIEQMYVEKGSFTEKEILDVAFNSKEEFFEFLYKVKELGIKEGNREVFPLYISDAVDNWGLLTLLSGHLWGYNTKSAGNNYFTYWDKKSDQIEYMFKQPFFKEILKTWTKLVQDGIADPDSLINTRATFEENVNNGMYAVLYGQALPDQNVLNAAGKDYGYRKVYINIPVDDSRFVIQSIGGAPGDRYALVKSDNLKEEDLPQVLRYFDFLLSDAGQKLHFWGPRSAGLYTEENGTRRYVDSALENELVYKASKDVTYKYGLNASTWPGYPGPITKYNPVLMYEMEPQATMANKYFSLGMINELETTLSEACNLYTFPDYGVENANKFWSARQSFETALTKIFAAKNDKQFETFYNDMIATAERNGLTDKTLSEINKVYANEINKDYMENLKD